MNDTIENVYNRDRTRKLTIYRRPDRSYGYAEEFYCDEPDYRCWLMGADLGSRFDSLEVARREAAGRIPWLSAVSPVFPRESDQ